MTIPTTRPSVPESGGRLYGFPPAADANARVLILGSMPSEASLKAGAYYAHPRNRFWPVMGELLGFSAELPYAERIQALKDHRIALWDTIGSCDLRFLRSTRLNGHRSGRSGCRRRAPQMRAGASRIWSASGERPCCPCCPQDHDAFRVMHRAKWSCLKFRQSIFR